MKKTNKINKTAFVVGTSIVAGLGSTAISADSNPFDISELSSGYMNTAEVDVVEAGVKKMKDGACGEGKCGGKMAGEAEKTVEGKCAGKMDDASKAAEGKCGDKKMDKPKAAEGKCGEGKCGNKK